MKNAQVAELLRNIAQMLELKGENPFRVRAFENAAQNIEVVTEDIENVSERGELRQIPGVGEGIEKKIKEYLKTGKLAYYENLKKEIPEGLLEIMSVPEVGPKTAKTLYDTLRIKNLSELEKAAATHRIRYLPHFGEKTEENILKGIRLVKSGGESILLSTALDIAEIFRQELEGSREVKDIRIAGSIRRGKETIRDIDILCTAENPATVMEKFVHLPRVNKIVSKGDTESSVLTDKGVLLDLRVVSPDSFGAALMYFTGSKQHNIRLRELALKKGLKINEYGLFRKEGKTETRIAGRTEEEVYAKLGMVYIPPELREDRGEIESAKRELPRLVEDSDIKGDFHIHSKYSDGEASIEEIAAKAKAMGFEWAVISDHSKSLKIADGLDDRRLVEKIKEIRKFNEKSRSFKLLCGSEVDIRSDGSLDYDDALLSELDVVIASIHTGFKQTEKQITGRLVSAMKNRYVTLIGHPTGRLIGKREPYAVDMEKFLNTASETGTAIEINAFPERMDLSDIYCKKAKELGILTGIGTDAHDLDQMEFFHLGICVARRGWLEKKDVLNALSYERLIRALKKKGGGRK